MAIPSPSRTLLFAITIAAYITKFTHGFPQPLQPYTTKMDLYSSLQPTCRIHRSQSTIPTIGATMYVPERHHRRPHFVEETDMYQNESPMNFQGSDMYLIPNGYEESQLGNDRILKTTPVEDYNEENDEGDDSELEDTLMYPKVPQNRKIFASRQISVQMARPQKPLFGLQMMNSYDLQPQYDEYEFSGYATIPQKRYQPHHTYFSQPVQFPYQHPGDHVIYSGYPQQFNRFLVETPQKTFRTPERVVIPEMNRKKITSRPKVVVLEKIEEISDAGKDISIEELIGEDSEGDVLFKVQGIETSDGENESENVQEDSGIDNEGVNKTGEKMTEDVDAMAKQVEKDVEVEVDTDLSNESGVSA